MVQKSKDSKSLRNCRSLRLLNCRIMACLICTGGGGGGGGGGEGCIGYMYVVCDIRLERTRTRMGLIHFLQNNHSNYNLQKLHAVEFKMLSGKGVMGSRSKF